MEIHCQTLCQRLANFFHFDKALTQRLANVDVALVDARLVK